VFSGDFFPSGLLKGALLERAAELPSRGLFFGTGFTVPHTGLL